jgi:DNA invertase Pin-like site-specific DNA recombinase
MMKNIRGGNVERVLCYKLDRLGRSLTHLALMFDEFNRLKIPLIARSQGIDTSDDNPAGRLQLGVLMPVAEFERGIIASSAESVGVFRLWEPSEGMI